MAYRTNLTVRFGDVDKAGIVYYPVILHYLHVAQEDFFTDYVRVPYHRMIEEERLGFPAVSDSTEFIKPIKYGDILEIMVYVSHVGKSSITFKFRVHEKESRELLVRSSQTKVAVNMDTWEPVQIPEKYHAIFSRCHPE